MWTYLLELCVDICVDMCADMDSGMDSDMCSDMCSTCVQTCAEICLNTCLNTCLKICLSTCPILCLATCLKTSLNVCLHTFLHYCNHECHTTKMLRRTCRHRLWRGVLQRRPHCLARAAVHPRASCAPGQSELGGTAPHTVRDTPVVPRQSAVFSQTTAHGP